MLLDDLKGLRKRALSELVAATDAAKLEEWRVRTLGRGGVVTLALRGLGSIPADQRPQVGREANALRREIEAAYADRKAALEQAVTEVGARLDVTLPGRHV